MFLVVVNNLIIERDNKLGKKIKQYDMNNNLLNELNLNYAVSFGKNLKYKNQDFSVRIIFVDQLQIAEIRKYFEAIFRMSPPESPFEHLWDGKVTMALAFFFEIVSSNLVMAWTDSPETLYLERGRWVGCG